MPVKHVTKDLLTPFNLVLLVVLIVLYLVVVMVSSIESVVKNVTQCTFPLDPPLPLETCIALPLAFKDVVVVFAPLTTMLPLNVIMVVTTPTVPTDVEPIANVPNAETVLWIRVRLVTMVPPTPTAPKTDAEPTVFVLIVVTVPAIPLSLVMTETMLLVMVVTLAADWNVVTEIWKPVLANNATWVLPTLTLPTLAEPTASFHAVVMESSIPTKNATANPTTIPPLTPAEPTAVFPIVVMVSSILPEERNAITELLTLTLPSTDAPLSAPPIIADSENSETVSISHLLQLNSTFLTMSILVPGPCLLALRMFAGW